MGGQASTSGSFPRGPCPRDVNADWMSALCPRLWDVPLHHLSIPGECPACLVGAPAVSWVQGAGKPQVP